jgi:hypothetical protein
MTEDLDMESVFSESSSEQVKQQIDDTLQRISDHQWTLGKAYVRLGCLSLEVRENKYWSSWGYPSFGSFVDSIKDRLDRGRSTVYATISVAERLLPHVLEADLERMGISRAQELARFVKQSGRKVTPRLLLMALDDSRTIEELHSAVLEELQEKGEVKGKWWAPFAGSYYTPEEKLEVQQAMSAARNVLGLGVEVPDHQAHKLILLAFAQEFQSSNPMEG